METEVQNCIVRSSKEVPGDPESTSCPFPVLQRKVGRQTGRLSGQPAAKPGPANSTTIHAGYTGVFPHISSGSIETNQRCKLNNEIGFNQHNPLIL